jgi:hypothetical protein
MIPFWFRSAIGFYAGQSNDDNLAQQENAPFWLHLMNAS